jgi:CheY-like chemotaxis protein
VVVECAEVLGPAPDIAGAMTLLTAGRAPDVALLDVNLCKEMVFPLADWLDQAHIPFVFATGYQRATIPDPYKCHDCLEKPYDMQELTRMLVGVRHRIR